MRSLYLPLMIFWKAATGQPWTGLVRAFGTDGIDMKTFLIKYRFKEGSPEDWHRHIGRFIAALDSAPT